jgi:hypothetical protein
VVAAPPPHDVLVSHEHVYVWDVVEEWNAERIGFCRDLEFGMIGEGDGRMGLVGIVYSRTWIQWMNG